MAHMGKKISVVALMLCSLNAMAEDGQFWQKGYMLAGEIIITPPPASGKSSAAATAADNRERARSYLRDGTPDRRGPVVIVVPEDEGGVLSPRDGESLPENRAKTHADEYVRKPGSHGQILIVPGRDPSKPVTRQEQMEINHSRARAWVKGDAPLKTRGPDNLPVVNCRDVDSVSGRIGDDTQSGSVITLFQNGKQVKVRCK